MKSSAEMAAARSAGRTISMVTCYDYWSARAVAASRVDAILVGDSAAMVMHGHETTIPADVDMMCFHASAVRRGAPEKLVVVDMPFLAHRHGLDHTMTAVERLVRSGAQAVKIEGADGTVETIRHIVDSGVDVMGHLGLTPQSVHKLGGFKVQGRNEEAARKVADDARRLEEAGCFAVVLEMVPSELAGTITQSLSIPTIGIGAGPMTSGQVLVLHDMLGLQPDFRPKFLRTWLDGFDLIRNALDRYDGDVKDGGFPSDEESYR